MKKYYILVSSILFSIKISWSQNLFQNIIGFFGDDSALCVNNTKDNGYSVGGYTFNSSNNSKDAIVIKLNNSGAIEWQTNFGNFLDDQIFDIHEIIDADFYTCGSIGSNHHL